MPIDNRISLLKLEVYCAVVRYGGVGRAADALFISQPVVSAHLKWLQEKVGAELFRRQGRVLKLTEAGEHVLAWAQQAIESAGDLGEELDALAHGVAGRVAFGSTLSVGNYLLPDLLVDFARRFPRIRVSMFQSTTDVVLGTVLDGDSDFAIVTSGARIHSARLTAILVARPELALAAPVDLELPARITLAQLADLPFVCPPSGSGARDGQDAALAELGVKRRNVVMEGGSAESIKRMVAAGLGVALLSEMSLRDDIAAGLLRRIDLDVEIPRDHLYLVHREGKTFTPAQRGLLGHFREALTQTNP